MHPFLKKFIHKCHDDLLKLTPEQLVLKVKKHQVLLATDPSTKGSDVLYGTIKKVQQKGGSGQGQSGSGSDEAAKM